MNKEQELKQEVLKKLEKEYDNFIKELTECKPEVIVERAYEKVVKQEMKDYFINKNLSQTEAKALLKSQEILVECYNDWENRDGNFSEVLDYSVDDTIKIITDSYNRKIKEQHKESR